jgi:hypothetical protein
MRERERERKKKREREKEKERERVRERDSERKPIFNPQPTPKIEGPNVYISCTQIRWQGIL